MSGILVVERSATLAHLLARTLQAAQFARWSELTSYGEALEHLRHSQTQGTPYRVVLLGTPPRQTREFAELLKFLKETHDPPLPVLVLMGGVLALSSHSAKASARLMINASPEPISNVVVSFAEDGEAALQTLAADPQVDAILMDLMMPRMAPASSISSPHWARCVRRCGLIHSPRE